MPCLLSAENRQSPARLLLLSNKQSFSSSKCSFPLTQPKIKTWYVPAQKRRWELPPGEPGMSPLKDQPQREKNLPNHMWPKQQLCTIKWALWVFSLSLSQVPLEMRYEPLCSPEQMVLNGSFLFWAWWVRAGSRTNTTQQHQGKKCLKAHEKPSLLLPSQWAHNSWNLSQCSSFHSERESFKCKLSSRGEGTSEDQ